MIKGETILSGAPNGPRVSEFKVMKSAAGYYIGTTIKHLDFDCHVPYTRETGYFNSEMDAQRALNNYKETGVLEKQR